MSTDFIIIEPDPIVSLDIGWLISVEYPGCKVTKREPPAQDAEVVSTYGPETTLIVSDVLLGNNAKLKQEAKNALDRGCPVLILGKVNTFDERAQLVKMPFTSAMFRNALNRRKMRDEEA